MTTDHTAEALKHAIARERLVSQAYDGQQQAYRELEALYNAMTRRCLEAEKKLQRAEAALQSIHDNSGVVCHEFETCAHPACTSSHYAWIEADAYFKPGLYQPATTQEVSQ